MMYKLFATALWKISRVDSLNNVPFPLLNYNSECQPYHYPGPARAQLNPACGSFGAHDIILSSKSRVPCPRSRVSFHDETLHASAAHTSYWHIPQIHHSPLDPGDTTTRNQREIVLYADCFDHSIGHTLICIIEYKSNFIKLTPELFIPQHRSLQHLVDSTNDIQVNYFMPVLNYNERTTHCWINIYQPLY